MHKYAHGAKEMQLELSQKLFNFYYVKKVFDKYRKVVDGICGMKTPKKNTREKLEGSAETLRGAAENVEKKEAKSSSENEEKINVQKMN